MMIAQMKATYIPIIKDVFTPKEHYRNIDDIDLGKLYDKGYRNVFLDIDNTLMSYEERELSLQNLEWVERIKQTGFRCFILSNNLSKRRIERISKQMKVPGVYFALKPFTYSIQELSKQHGISLKHSIIIGDQVLKDIVLGNWTQMYTILVDPIDIRKSFFKTLQRDMEIKILDILSTL